jgi:hypothetical protein
VKYFIFFICGLSVSNLIAFYYRASEIPEHKNAIEVLIALLFVGIAFLLTFGDKGEHLMLFSYLFLASLVCGIFLAFVN